MAWKIEFDSAAAKDLKKLPKSEQKKLLKAIRHNDLLVLLRIINLAY